MSTAQSSLVKDVFEPHLHLLKERWRAQQVISWLIAYDPFFLERDIWSASRAICPWPPPSQWMTFDQARWALRDAIGAGLTAYGFHSNAPHLGEVKLDSSLFRFFPHLGVDVDGHTTNLRPQRRLKAFPQFEGISFDEKQVRELWPKPAPDLAAAANELSTPGPVKRDPFLQSMIEKTGCTRNEALTQYNKLPPSRKLRRGNPGQKGPLK